MEGEKKSGREGKASSLPSLISPSLSPFLVLLFVLRLLPILLGDLIAGKGNNVRNDVENINHHQSRWCCRRSHHYHHCVQVTTGACLFYEFFIILIVTCVFFLFS